MMKKKTLSSKTGLEGRHCHFNIHKFQKEICKTAESMFKTLNEKFKHNIMKLYYLYNTVD